MQSMTLRTHVGKDGILKLKMPIGIKNKDLDVIVLVHPLDDVQPIAEWPANFFTEIIGSWEGAPLVREPQGSYEARDQLK
jgi:hypothetical protein